MLGNNILLGKINSGCKNEAGMYALNHFEHYLIFIYIPALIFYAKRMGFRIQEMS